MRDPLDDGGGAGVSEVAAANREAEDARVRYALDDADRKLSVDELLDRIAPEHIGALRERLEERRQLTGLETSRAMAERLFPTRGQAQGAHQLHEAAQLVLHRGIAFADKGAAAQADLGIGIARLREALMYLVAAVGRDR